MTMIHPLNLTTATAALVLGLGLGSAALAESHTADAEGAMAGQTDGAQMADYDSGRMGEDQMANLIRVSEITDGVVYTVEVDDDDWLDWDGSEADVMELEQIGNITDVAMSRDGRMTGIIVETGGFLDIGDSHVLMTLDDIRLMDDATGDSYSFVTRLSQDELANLPEVGENWF
jgi:hypothetical protein